MAEQTPEERIARFEELSVLEAEFEDAEIQLIRKSDEIHAPLYKKRADLIAKIPHFWALVFEQSPPEVEQYILPSDSKVFAESLETLEVSRFEIDDPKGSPRSFSIKFGFGENEYFEDRVLEKKFWFRKSLDGWQGLVSEPVKIAWKEGNDLSGGLTDAAYKLWQAKQAKAGGDAKKATQLPEYKELAQKIEQSEEPQPSFFAWFGFVSSYKWVSAEESEQANQKEAEALEKKKKGEKVEEEEEDEEDDGVDSQETEVFPVGDQLATIIAEDMWPSAVKYYIRAHEDEGDDDDLSELEVEDLDDESDDEEVDIAELVGKSKKRAAEDSPASKKKQKKA
ncbi:uncharacterized protein EI97DRAFT_43668 [Westerdykella ornata]|uniref:NAP family protein n=1 Tax=Westerdykella ornata TaxID=318751 RepID=A0A6A6JJV7_WESOR|nr:uncharacterized protein EI97DRAFT_43668 [Westerdykella ornata]KAF2276544.1 hypothetical protein EI97DRAFT_43668 [Westerdykella ornata]